MQHQYLSANALAIANDWRPVYHLSRAAELMRIGAEWPRLSSIGVQLHDGWRFSDRAGSDWYLKNISLKDPAKRNPITAEYLPLNVTETQQKRAEQYRIAIEGERYYRMRHIGEMHIKPDAQLMKPPAFSDLNACITPNDILLRRIGKVSAALVSQYHRRHPVDANIAIIRGLNARQAVWLAYCLNQPLYKSYLEQQFSGSSLIRVGLKHLANMPVTRCPVEFNELADEFHLNYESLVRSDDTLFALRKDVQGWLDQHLPLTDDSEGDAEPKFVARFFKAQDLGLQLNYAATEQASQARILKEEFGCVPIRQLAAVNPKITRLTHQHTTTGFQIIKIKDINEQQAITKLTESSSESAWRYHKRLLSKFDVLVSTFVQEPKVAIVSNEISAPTFASEQLAVLNFHHTPGAYALLMETPMVRRQITGLATGMVQRFIQPKMLERIVLPRIDRDMAHKWHHQLIELLKEKASANEKLEALYKKMYLVYRQLHPEMNR